VTDAARAAGEQTLPLAPWQSQSDVAPSNWALEGPHPGPVWKSLTSPGDDADGEGRRSSLDALKGSDILSNADVLKRPEVMLGLAFTGGLLLAAILKRLAR
jgi:hypothetical protein